jgi:hypothetical protein
MRRMSRLAMAFSTVSYHLTETKYRDNEANESSAQGQTQWCFKQRRRVTVLEKRTHLSRRGPLRCRRLSSVRLGRHGPSTRVWTTVPTATNC